jgi:hypothetical protein
MWCAAVVFIWDIPGEVICCSVYLPGICLVKWHAMVCTFQGYPRGSDMLQFVFTHAIPGEAIWCSLNLNWDIPHEVTCCGLHFLGISQGKWYAAVCVHPGYPRWSDMLQSELKLGYPTWSDLLWSALNLGYPSWSDMLLYALNLGYPRHSSQRLRHLMESKLNQWFISAC